MIDPFATEKRKKSVSLKRNLSGHFGKVLDLQWCKHPHKSRYDEYQIRITTLQSIMNAKLSLHRFWPCHENETAMLPLTED